jgi:DNA end-binding protein Ku
MFCPAEETMVAPDEIVRGYEFVPGKYVLITDEELESLSPERSRTIEIIEFIDRKEVDPVYYDHPYYLVPLKGGEKAYQLLVEVMRRTNRAGLARVVLAEREYLVAVSSRDGALALTTLHYSDEILPDEDIAPKKKEKLEAEEESRMRATIEQMIEDFNPGKYADRRRTKLMDILAAKAKEQTLVEAPRREEEEGGEGPADLVAALEESMRKVKEGR